MHHPAYRPEIDGLRAVAVISVLIFHLNPDWLPGGFIGVDIFFVISGFLITSIINKEINKKEFSFANFYARRAKRIYPALFAVLILCSVFAYISLPPDEYKTFFKALRYALLQLGNVHFSHEVDYFAQGLAPSPLLHTWSLGVEEQFYLIWPLLMALSCKWISPNLRPTLFSFLLLSSLITSQLLLSFDSKQAYYMPYSRGWELLFGGLLAFGRIPPINRKETADLASALALLVMLGCMLGYDEQHFPGFKALLPVMATALFIHSASHRKGIGHRLLSTKPALAIGLCSYSLYLWHWPLIAFTKILTDKPLSALSTGIICITCAALAKITYKFVEQPVQKLKLPPRSVLIASLLFIIAGVASTNILKRLDFHSSRFTHNHDLKEAQAIDTKALCKDDFKKSCTPYPDGSYDVLLAGDSHGAHYAPLILDWAKSHNYRVKIITQGGCPTWLQINSRTKKTDSKTCIKRKQQVTQVLENIKQHLFFAIKASDLPSDYNIKQADEFEALINPLIKKPQKRKVTLLLQAPTLNKNPNNCRFKQSSRFNTLISGLYKDAPHCIDEINNINVASSNSLLKDLAGSNAWHTYSPSPLDHNFVNAQGKLLYKDKDHLNIYGNHYLSNHFKNSINATLDLDSTDLKH